MAISSQELLKDRGGKSGDYSCPVHIPVEACLALFRERGIEPAPKTVGVLGDILENFALSLIGNSSGRTMSVDELRCNLAEALGE